MDRQTGRYQPWRPELWSDGGYELLSLTDDEHGLTIRLDHYPADGGRSVFEIAFPARRAYRTIDEGFRLKQWDKSWEATRSKSSCPLLTVADSDFLAEFHELSLHTLSGTPLVHYFVVTNNDCIDVLADAEPRVRRLDRPSSTG